MTESLAVRVKQELANRRLEELITALQKLRRETDPSIWARTIADAQNTLSSLEESYPYPTATKGDFLYRGMMAPKSERTRRTVKSFRRAMGLRE